MYSYMDPLWTHSYQCNIYIHIFISECASASTAAPYFTDPFI